MNENLADEIRKTIESIKDMKTQASGINNYLSILEGMMRADIQKKVDEAYKRGLEDGKKAFDLLDAERDSEYQRGLDDAWEAARKIADMWTRIDNDELLAIFGITERIGHSAIKSLFGKQTANEAMLELEAYEEKQKAENEINVGDEVDWSGDKFIVTRIFQPYDKAEECDGVDMDGCTYHDVLISGLTKTGRHVDITDMLKGALE